MKQYGCINGIGDPNTIYHFIEKLFWFRPTFENRHNIIDLFTFLDELYLNIRKSIWEGFE